MPELCDISSSIKYVYRLSRFFGILPYTIETTNGKTKATPSHYCFLLTILTSLVIFAHGVTFPFYVFGSEMPCFFCITPQILGLNSTQQFILTPFLFQKIALKIINRFVVSSMSFCALFFALFFSTRMPAFIEKLSDTDYFFRALLKHSQKSVTCCISEWIVFILLVGGFPAISYYMYTDISGPDTTVTSIAWLVVLMWDNLNSATCECLFINFAYIIKVLFVVFAMVVGTTIKHSSGMYEEIIKRIFWVIFYGARFFALIRFACKTVQAAEHTKTLVAEISSSGEQEEIKKELLLFNSQIASRNIEFTACSLFTLNSSLITSAVGLGTTYIVILIQFHAPT